MMMVFGQLSEALGMTSSGQDVFLVFFKTLITTVADDMFSVGVIGN